MTYLIAEPQMLASAAAEIDGIGSAFSAANAAAAAPTSGLVAAAEDEVSAAIADVFGAFGREYQAAAAQFEAFHGQFQQTLASAGIAYVHTEAAIASTLGLGAGGAVPATTFPPFPANPLSIFIGGTGVPLPDATFITNANNTYVRSAGTIMAGTLQALGTPEELYPITGTRSLTFDQSASVGLNILDNELYNEIHIHGNSVTIFGVSQSAVISSLEMQNLANGASIFTANHVPIPTPSQLNFVLAGNEVNPNGGMLARFPGLSLPAVGLTFYPAMNANTPYSVANYTGEYDGFSDFPRYPIDIFSDLNAVAGIVYVHTQYLNFTPTMIDHGAIQVPTSPGYTGNTTYYVIPTAELPLLRPLDGIPFIGKPLVDLLQPDLRVLVNLGYGGDPTLGYSTPADVPTPVGLFPDANPGTVLNALAAGTQQGIHGFSVDMQQIASQPAVVPQFSFPTAPDPTTILANLPSPQKVVDTVNSVVSTDYGVLLPTADLGFSLVTDVPVYDAQLFASYLGQGSLVNAIGIPIAADVGLGTIAGGVELLTVASALSSNITDIQNLIP